MSRAIKTIVPIRFIEGGEALKLIEEYYKISLNKPIGIPVGKRGS